MQCVHSLTNSLFGFTFATIVAILFLWGRVVKTFSFTVEELSRPENKKVLRAVSTFMATQTEKITAPPSLPSHLGLTARAAHWFTAALYCFYVAWFTIDGLCVFALGMLRLQQSMKALALVALSFFMIGCAKYFHKHAKYLHSALCNLTPMRPRAVNRHS